MFHYTAFGDSLTAGYGVGTGEGFAHVLSGLIEQRVEKPVSLYTHGMIGATSQQLLTLLLHHAELQKKMKQAQLITLTAGGNDLIQGGRRYARSGSRWSVYRSLVDIKHNVARMIEIVENWKRGQPYRMIVLELYNPIPEIEDVGFFIEQYNQLLHRFENEKVKAAAVQQKFVGKVERLMSEDGIHPNQYGHVKMAQAVLSCL